jgi:predicted nucleic acid-binding protein
LRAALRGAWEAEAEVIVPAAVLAEQYRGGTHDQVVDSYLGRETGIKVVPTTRPLARQIGHLLSRAGRGSREHVDATVIAAAIAGGGGVIVTGDPDDLTALAEGLVGIAILPV